MLRVFKSEQHCTIIGLLRRSALKVHKLPRRKMLSLNGISRPRCVTVVLPIRLVLVLHIKYTSNINTIKVIWFSCPEYDSYSNTGIWQGSCSQLAAMLHHHIFKEASVDSLARLTLRFVW